MAGNETYIDLRKVRLYGWEGQKSDLAIGSFLEGIEAGDIFPPVKVSRSGRKTYWIMPSEDGGHHRAVAHYLSGKPLRCEVINNQKVEMKRPVLVSEIRIVKDGLLAENKRFAERLKDSPSYR